MTLQERMTLSEPWLNDTSACAMHLSDVMLRTRGRG